MKVMLYVSQKKALLEGKNEFGKITIDVDPQLLSQEEREQLAKERFSGDVIEVVDEYGVPSIGEATVENLKLILAAKMEIAKKRAEEAELKRRGLIQKVLQTPAEDFFSREEIEGRKKAVAPWDRHFEWRQMQPTPEEEPLIEAKKGEIMGYIKILDKKYEEVLEKARIIEEEARALAAAKAAQIARWVAEKGTESQKERLADGMLPEKEITDAIRDEVFEPLSHWPRYRRITASDICRCGYSEPCEAEFSVEDKKEATEAEYNQLRELKRLMPGAKVILRLHTGEASRCGGKEERSSALVTVKHGAFEFSREYAIE